jgi:hypothetical protein
MIVFSETKVKAVGGAFCAALRHRLPVRSSGLRKKIAPGGSISRARPTE